MSANAALRRSTRTRSISTRSLSAGSSNEESSSSSSSSDPEPLPSAQRKRIRPLTSASKSADGKPPPKKIKEGKNVKKEDAPSQHKPKPTTDNDPKKWTNWSAHSKSTPFPDFGHPTRQECEEAFHALKKLHQADVEKEFDDENTPETIPHVLDAVIVAILSQATGWNNAKRAMNSMKAIYGSIFAYEKITAGGREKLQDALKPGGLHVRKSMIITTILDQVHSRYGEYNLDHLKDVSDDDAMKELLSYKYMGPKSASVVMSWCLKRSTFTVDVHIYRIAGLWGWRPAKATKELTQSHLFAMIPEEMHFDLHFLLIAHGRACPACKGGAKKGEKCLIGKVVKEDEEE